MLVVVQSFFLSLSTDFSWFSIRPHPVFGDSTSAANRLEIPTVDFVCLFVFFFTDAICLFVFLEDSHGAKVSFSVHQFGSSTSTSDRVLPGCT